jgi:hypothetical protein
VSIFTQVSFTRLPDRFGSADFAECAGGFRVCENRTPYVSSVFRGVTSGSAFLAVSLLGTRRSSSPDEIEAVAAEAGATPARLASADSIELTAGQISKLDNLTLAAGDTHEEADMRLIGR